ncbi:MAG: 4Fe-4S binding protein [Deltaproteobacteria bacterium]|nr:4Fe-4S binding protein [Deltaproteobacteria bacterium]
MSRPDWLIGFIKKTFIRDEKKMAAAKLPVFGRIVEHFLFEGDHLVCLPRDQVVTVNQNVEDPGQTVLPSALADHLIDKAEHLFLMDFCICRTSMECRDYPVKYGCLFMGEATRDINPGWGRFVTKDEARAHLARCREAGLIHFVGRSKLDTVWLGIGPGEKLLTVCNCCPCCCITRGLPYVGERFAGKIHKAPGVSVSVGEDCIGCGSCVDACFAHAITLSDGRAEIGDECRGCGRCVETCPQTAISLTVDPALFPGRPEEHILNLVDI